ncbi:MAG: NfeD family protein [Candidatus Cloacimonetes bacterium]|nr:NfeD family protein [Candidatus Cloacimonadota bacterium]
MEPWMIWIAIGVVCMIIEIFTPGFFFMSIGIGAILTGLISLILTGTVWQILTFALVTFIVFISTRKLSRKLISQNSQETNIFALKGKTGIVTREIPNDGRGYVKIGGEEWSAMSENGEGIEVGAKILVVGLEGNKLIVRFSQKEE